MLVWKDDPPQKSDKGLPVQRQTGFLGKAAVASFTKPFYSPEITFYRALVRLRWSEAQHFDGDNEEAVKAAAEAEIARLFAEMHLQPIP